MLYSKSLPNWNCVDINNRRKKKRSQIAQKQPTIFVMAFSFDENDRLIDEFAVKLFIHYENCDQHTFGRIVVNLRTPQKAFNLRNDNDLTPNQSIFSENAAITIDNVNQKRIVICAYGTYTRPNFICIFWHRCEG